MHIHQVPKQTQKWDKASGRQQQENGVEASFPVGCRCYGPAITKKRPLI